MSQDEGSSDTKKSSLHDTVPGVPEMELGRTLPTGAAFEGLPPAAAAKRAAASESSNTPFAARSSAPPPGTGGPLSFGTTRRDFGSVPVPKLSAREKAKRNVLTHTLQMPLVVSPVPPKAAPAQDTRQDVRRMTIQGSGATPAAPAGWTSVHRVGSGAPPEPTSSRPPARSTVPLHQFHQVHEARFEQADPSEPQPGADASERFRRAEPGEPFRPLGGASVPDATSPASSREMGSDAAQQRSPAPSSPFAWQYPMPPSESERNRWRLEYERDTLPGGASSVRVPSLSPKEWMFIGLLAVASAATLYSLLVDEVSSPLEEDVGAATSVAPEHVVTPAPLPEPAAPPAAPQASAATGNVTEIRSEPAHAEIVLGGAVIGNTPAQVVRGERDADYLLRKSGYEPQIVRVSPHSPKSITITLHAKQF